jgi:phenylpropionate dioxygenase-like ring-hydroxylating dioxygenase large terminal subunit
MATAHISGLTEVEAAGIQQHEKPAEGSWTRAMGFDTGPVSFKDTYDPEFYELEKEAVFRRSWLNIGRVEDLPRPGAYFTKELEFLGVSVLVLRGMDNEIRAFHNVCSHRGNKLMWDDLPSKESKGNCRQISCKYHGWRYGLDGEINYVHNAPEFFDLKAEDLALPKINLESWAGFIFINLEETPRQSLREFLTPTIAKLESYPFEKMTQCYRFEAEIKANWKLYVDAFQEAYHVPYLHGKMNDPTLPATGVDKVPFMMPAFALYGKHRHFASPGPKGNEGVVQPGGKTGTAGIFRADFFGPRDVPDVGPFDDCLNPTGIENWGLDSFQIYPSFAIDVYARNLYTTFHYWPNDVGSHKFVFTMYFVPPENAIERLAQHYAVETSKEFFLQDANLLEGVQSQYRSEVRDQYYLCDQEVMVRHLHKVVQEDVEAYRRELDGK